MDTSGLTQIDPNCWLAEPDGGMRVPAIFYADEALLRGMDEKVREQACNVARLPGIVGASYTMPDAHWGYGFPIGGVAAFDPDEGGVVSAGGVGFDISCGVRTLTTGLTRRDVEPIKTRLVERLYRDIPAGLGATGRISLNDREMDAMLKGGARWAIAQGWGEESDLERIEETGRMAGARPDCVSDRARRRQRNEMGTLGSGNHYAEVQEISEIFDEATAHAFGLDLGGVVVSIHSGSRGLGHQIGTEFLTEMVAAAPAMGIDLPERELACAPLRSEMGERYLGAMRAAINCALANRQILSELVRGVFAALFPGCRLKLLYDVSHNTCKEETHRVDGIPRTLFVHRKGATRAFGPGHPDIPAWLRDIGQPVLIGGSMGTGSHILVGTIASGDRSWSSACHGAGRNMSRRRASRLWQGKQIVRSLAKEGIIVRSPSERGVAEEAPGAYKDVDAVVDAAEAAGLARKVARCRPLVCVKG
ncbi:MAG: RtcB family protein [Gammaproteobacteria bacterium]|jgi:tRNA-splicing ligase RtcB|nr:RtcB family protein [Gammaproteobacteria bacterium]